LPWKPSPGLLTHLKLVRLSGRNGPGQWADNEPISPQRFPFRNRCAEFHLFDVLGRPPNNFC
jgi:hypothetical protein